MKKKSPKKKIVKEIRIPIHIHGIFNSKTEKVTKVSLDEDEIDMELALNGADSNVSKCYFDITLIL